MIQKGIVKRVGSNRVDIQLIGSTATLKNVAVSSQVSWDLLVVNTQVLVDFINDQPVVLHTLGSLGEQRTYYAPQINNYNTVIENALLADGSVSLTGDLYVSPGVTIDGYDISVLGEGIDNLQAGDTWTRTGYTILTHGTNLVSALSATDTTIIVRAQIFVDNEIGGMSNTNGEVEFIRFTSGGTAMLDDKGSVCYSYTCDRRVETNPSGVYTGWAAGTLINGMGSDGWVTVDTRNGHPASPSITLGIWLSDPPDPNQKLRIVRIGSLANTVDYVDGDLGFAVGDLSTPSYAGQSYLSYSLKEESVTLSNSDIISLDRTGSQVFRVWATEKTFNTDDGSRAPGSARFGLSSDCLDWDAETNQLSIINNSQPIITFDSDGGFITGVLQVGSKTGPQISIGKGEGVDYNSAFIAARNTYNVPEFLVETGDNYESVHVHIGRPKPTAGYLEFEQGELKIDGTVWAREFRLLGGGSIDDGSELVNSGKIVAGTGDQVAILDGEDATWRIYAGDATPATAPFRVNQDGQAWLEDATIAGEITADTGYIGGINGWVIGTGKITSTYVGLATTTGDPTYVFWAGDDIPADANFTVTHGGVLKANSATVVGAITASTGYIGGSGGWVITTGKFYGGSGSAFSGMIQGTGTTKAFFSGATDANGTGALFYATAAGALVATSATISGAITATSGSITGSLYVGSAIPRIHIDGANKLIESTNYASGSSGFRLEGVTGDVEVNNLTSRGAIKSAVFEYNRISVTAGTSLVAHSADVLATDMTALDASTLTINGTVTFTVGDILRIKEGASDEWLEVTNAASAPTYTVTRDKAAQYSSNNNPAWKAGAAVVDYGQSNDGYVLQTADLTNAPYVSIATHAGAPWSTITERARLGNLTGISGASGYGLWSDNVFLTGEISITNPEDIAGSEITNDLGWTQGSNLIENGSAEGGASNWSTWTRSTGGGHEGDAYLSYTASYGYHSNFNDDAVTVDPTGQYELAAALKTSASSGVFVFVGFDCLTEDETHIEIVHCYRNNGYDTTLYEDVLAGATVLKIVPPSGDWTLISNPAIQFEVLANGADLPNFSARRIESIVKTGASYWTVTLYAWDPMGSNYSAGTAVGLSSASNTYNYHLATNEEIGTDWEYKTATISSENAWNVFPVDGQFRIGTRKIRFLALIRDAGGTLYVDTVSLTRIQQATINAATTATNFFGSNGSLVNTPSPSGAGLYMGSTHMGYYNGSAWKTYMDNTGKFYFSGATGARIAWDGTDLLGSDGTTVQWYARASTGKLYAAAGAVYLDENGVNLTYATDDTTYSKMIKWWNGANRIGQMYTKETSSEPWLMLESTPVSNSKYGYLHLRAYGKDSNGDYNSTVIKLRGGNDLTGDTGVVQLLYNNNVTADLGPSGNTFYTKTTSGVSLKAKAISGQTGDLFRALDGSGNRLWGIDIAGGVVSAVGAIWFHEWLEDTQSDGNGMKFHYGTGSWWATDTGGSTQYAYMPLRFDYLRARARLQITKATIYYNTQTSGAYITSVQIMQANADGTTTQLAVDNTDLGNGSTGDGSADSYSGTLTVPDKPLFVRVGYTGVSSAGDVRVYGVRMEYTTITA